MCVLGKHYFIITELSTARKVSVGAFAEEVRGLEAVPLVDAMLVHNCQQTNQVYPLVLQNILHIESMDDNLSTSFILREAGIIMNDQAKIL